MKRNGILVLILLLVSLVPVYLLYRYSGKMLRPRESLPRFFAWMLLVLLLVFGYTFLLVWFIQTLFPPA